MFENAFARFKGQIESRERRITLLELLDNAGFIFADRPLAIDAKGQAVLTPETRQLIGRLRAALEASGCDRLIETVRGTGYRLHA